jgi:hypothetical protein
MQSMLFSISRKVLPPELLRTYAGSLTLTNGAWTTLINATGSGRFLFAALGWNQSGVLRITIDGVLLRPTHGVLTTKIGSDALIGPYRFNTSLKVEAQSTVASNSYGLTVLYSLFS